MPNRLLCFAAALLIAACGSQANRAVLSDASFDRCFDMDFDPHESPSDKSACWREWLDARYQAEADDKIRYAEMRRAEIAQGQYLPGPPSAASSYSHRPRLFDTDVFNKKKAQDAGEPVGTETDGTDTEGTEPAETEMDSNQ